MTYVGYFGLAAVIALAVLLRGIILNAIPAFKGTYRPDRRVEGGALLMVGSLVAAGWIAGLVGPEAFNLLMIAGAILAIVGFAVLAIGVVKEAKQWV
jgi:uncharacterized membrane protein